MNRTLTNDSEILVSVEMITYNHENYIAQAIEGILMQETSFKYELVIANDCSPDNTDVIVRHYINNHPKGHLIKYYCHSRNLGMDGNALFALAHCKGKYIAPCEGDDYWIDPLKLQKQVDFLERNEDYIIHSGNVLHLFEEDNKTKNLNIIVGNEEYDANALMLRNPLKTCTVLFRNLSSINGRIETGYNEKISFGDWYMWYMLTKLTDKKAFKSAEIYSIYRVHNNGVYNGTNKQKINYQTLIQLMHHNEVFCAVNKQEYKIRLHNLFLNLFKSKYPNPSAFTILLKHFFHTPLSFPIRKYLSYIKYGS